MGSEIPRGVPCVKLEILDSCFAIPASMLGSSWCKIRTSRTTEQDSSSEREFRYRSPLMPTGSGAWEDRMGCVRPMVWDYGGPVLVRSVKAIT